MTSSPLVPSHAEWGALLVLDPSLSDRPIFRIKFSSRFTVMLDFCFVILLSAFVLPYLLLYNSPGSGILRIMDFDLHCNLPILRSAERVLFLPFPFALRM